MSRLLFGAVLLGVLHPAMTSAAQGNLEQRVERLERVMQSRALMEMQQRIDALEDEVARLRGQNEELAHALENLKLRQRELYLDTDRRLQALEAGGLPPATPGKTGGAAAAATAPPAASAAAAGSSVAASAVTGVPSDAERKAYKDAFELLKQGRYQRAIEAFSAFLKQYPNSGYAANAQYWLGEAYYVNKQYKPALEAFRKVVEHYPDSNKVPDARLKLGFTHYELGQWKSARKELEALVREEKGTSIARLAAKRLKRMKQEGH
ncbi:MAG: tol-pal system protein YbgF [Gammaproteobacteria bacterium]|nr:MAG: tol-pal system protein YbgF [Gammaproteobacteria bacterium]